MAQNCEVHRGKLYIEEIMKRKCKTYAIINIGRRKLRNYELTIENVRGG